MLGLYGGEDRGIPLETVFEMRRRLAEAGGEDPERRSLAHFWVGEKAPWFEIADALPRFERGPADHEEEIAEKLGS